jgi:rhodanese-related sulfurtransferase
VKVRRHAARDVADRVRRGHAVLVCAYDAPAAFSKFPLSGAMALDELRRRETELERDVELVFYCWCPNDKTSAERAAEYARRGFPAVAVLAGGVEAWRAAGLGFERALQRGDSPAR